MAYRIGPLERELTRRCFVARKAMSEALKKGDKLAFEYWRAQDDAYTSAAQLAEKYNA